MFLMYKVTFMSISSCNVPNKRSGFNVIRARNNADPFATVPLWRFLRDRISIGPGQDSDAPSTIYQTYYGAITAKRKLSDSLVLASILRGQKVEAKFSQKSLQPESVIRRRKHSPPKLPEKDLEKLREFVRFDNGMSQLENKLQRKINYVDSPKIAPRMNRVSLGRYRYVNVYYPRRPKMFCCKKKYYMEHIMQPASEIKAEEELRRLRKLASHYKMEDNNEFKFNKVFVLRYKYNKGAPEIPSSFREFYEDYNKPRFQHVNKLQVPRRIIETDIKDGEMSYLGIQSEMIIPLISQRRRPQRKVEKPLKKGKRTVRLKNVTPPARLPWNYGQFGNCNVLDALYHQNKLHK